MNENEKKCEKKIENIHAKNDVHNKNISGIFEYLLFLGFVFPFTYFYCATKYYE